MKNKKWYGLSLLLAGSIIITPLVTSCSTSTTSDGDDSGNKPKPTPVQKTFTAAIDQNALSKIGDDELEFFTSECEKDKATLDKSNVNFLVNFFYENPEILQLKIDNKNIFEDINQYRDILDINFHGGASSNLNNQIEVNSKAAQWYINEGVAFIDNEDDLVFKPTMHVNDYLSYGGIGGRGYSVLKSNFIKFDISGTFYYYDEVDDVGYNVALSGVYSNIPVNIDLTFNNDPNLFNDYYESDIDYSKTTGELTYSNSRHIDHEWGEDFVHNFYQNVVNLTINGVKLKESTNPYDTLNSWIFNFERSVLQLYNVKVTNIDHNSKNSFIELNVSQTLFDQTYNFTNKFNIKQDKYKIITAYGNNSIENLYPSLYKEMHEKFPGSDECTASNVANDPKLNNELKDSILKTLQNIVVNPKNNDFESMYISFNQPSNHLNYIYKNYYQDDNLNKILKNDILFDTNQITLTSGSTSHSWNEFMNIDIKFNCFNEDGTPKFVFPNGEPFILGDGHELKIRIGGFDWGMF